MSINISEAIILSCQCFINYYLEIDIFNVFYYSSFFMYNLFKIKLILLLFFTFLFVMTNEIKIKFLYKYIHYLHQVLTNNKNKKNKNKTYRITLDFFTQHYITFQVDHNAAVLTLQTSLLLPFVGTAKYFTMENLFSRSGVRWFFKSL